MPAKKCKKKVLKAQEKNRSISPKVTVATVNKVKSPGKVEMSIRRSTRSKNEIYNP